MGNCIAGDANNLAKFDGNQSKRSQFSSMKTGDVKFHGLPDEKSASNYNIENAQKPQVTYLSGFPSVPMGFSTSSNNNNISQNKGSPSLNFVSLPIMPQSGSGEQVSQHSQPGTPHCHHPGEGTPSGRRFSCFTASTQHPAMGAMNSMETSCVLMRQPQQSITPTSHYTPSRHPGGGNSLSRTSQSGSCMVSPVDSAHQSSLNMSHSQYPTDSSIIPFSLHAAGPAYGPNGGGGSIYNGRESVFSQPVHCTTPTGRHSAASLQESHSLHFTTSLQHMVVLPGANGPTAMANGLRFYNNNPHHHNDLDPQHPTRPTLTGYIVVAMFPYESRSADEVDLRKGERLLLFNNSDPDWWLVDKLESGTRGYVPASFVAFENSLESYDWFIHNLKRKDAERLLLHYGRIRGTFLIRDSETNPGAYSLSVLDSDDQSQVKHYRIRQVDHHHRHNNNGSSASVGHVFISSRQRFPSLVDLVRFYREGANGLCCALSEACPRMAPLVPDLCYGTRDHWEIDRKSIKLIQVLGAGQFGEVWRGTWNEHTAVAVKTLKAGSMPVEDFLKEARLMKELHHPHLVTLYAVCTRDEPIYIVTELMENGSLLECLRSETGVQLSLRVLVDMMAQIASGMSYLESKRFLHRDLAARNILVSGAVCKIADFGLARLMEARSDYYCSRESTKFPIKWTAPEAALMGKFTVKSDVWSYGVVLFEIVTRGQVPYAGMNNTETLKQVQAGYRMPRPAECPEAIYQVMLDTWHEKPQLRPTFSYLMEFFDNFQLHQHTSSSSIEMQQHTFSGEFHAARKQQQQQAVRMLASPTADTTAGSTEDTIMEPFFGSSPLLTLAAMGDTQRRAVNSNSRNGNSNNNFLQHLLVPA